MATAKASNTSYTFTGTDGKSYTATPTAKTTAAQEAAVKSNSAYKPVASNTNNQSTTTLSSDKTKDILNTSNGLNSMTRGVTSNPETGVSTYANGSVYDTADTKNEDDTINTILNNMLSQTDADTASSIQSIKNKYKLLSNQQEKVNESQSAATQGALFRSGAAQGDAYANNTVGYQTQQNLNALQALDMEQEDAINAAKAAQSAGRMKVAELQYNQALAAKNRKLALADQVNADLIKTKQQADRDAAVANLYSAGTTDIQTILTKLNAAGTPVTAEQVAQAIKNITPPGLDDLVKTMRDNGAPSGVIVKVLQSKDINEAYKNAGNWAAGGTGDLRDYNIYKAQAIDANQNPLTYQDWLQLKENGYATTTTSGAGSAAKNVAASAGITDTSIPLSTAIAQVGVDAIVDGIIKNEGASPKGVVNNPGNIKYRGLPGQTDSGVKASDGGTFANYATAQAGRQAIASIVTNAAAGNSSAYGANPTFEQFMNKYTNTAPKSEATSGALNTILGSGKFTKDQTKAITNAINNGEDPATVIKNQAKNIMGATEAAKLTNYEVAKSQMNDIQDLLTQYYAAGGKTSLLSGKYEKVVNNLGQVNDPNLVSLATQISAALQVYRNAVSGTAYSVKEGAEIASIFPGINKSEGLNKAILDGRMKAFDSTIDSTYKTALGSSYDKLKALEQTPDDVHPLVQSEEQAKTKVIQYGATNPQVRDAIKKMVGDGKPYLQIIEILGLPQ